MTAAHQAPLCVGFSRQYNATKWTLGGCELQQRGGAGRENDDQQSLTIPPPSSRAFWKVPNWRSRTAGSAMLLRAVRKRQAAPSPMETVPAVHQECACAWNPLHVSPRPLQCSEKSAQALGGPLPHRTPSWSPTHPFPPPLQVIDTRCGLRDEGPQNGGPRRPVPNTDTPQKLYVTAT